MPETERQPPGYETRDVDLRLPLYTAMSVLVLLVVVLFVVWLLSGGAGGGIPSLWTSSLFEQPLKGPAPALESDPRGELGRSRQQAQARLESYGWIDRSQGIVHIPIERAMDLYASHPARERDGGSP
jgi:hypothetical protein